MSWSIPKKTRRKYLDSKGEKLPSVTEILGGLGWNREVLMGWANKIGRQGQTIAEVRNPKADAGTLAHHLIECELTNVPWKETQEFCEAPEDLQVKAMQALEAWSEWWKGREADGWEVVDAEIAMQDDDAGFAGTCDLMLRDPSGELIVADIKTGSPHAEAIIQMAAYGILYSETPKYALLIHVPTDGRPVTCHFASDDTLRQAEEIWENLLSISKYKKAWAAIGKKMYADTPKLEEPKKASPF